MLAFIKIPHEPFNTLVRNGRAGEILGRIIEELKPESIYFTEQNGNRGAVALFEVENSSRIPYFAEPLFPELQCGLRVQNRHDARRPEKRRSE